MSSTVNIRLCKIDDLAAVLSLISELSEVAHGSHSFNLVDMQRVFDEMEKFPDIYLNLVAEVSGKVAGYISVIFYKTVFHKGGTALINELVVTDRERGKGIGQRLVQVAKEQALVRGLDEIEVGTEKTNELAQRFYHKCGFDEEFILLGMEF